MNLQPNTDVQARLVQRLEAQADADIARGAECAQRIAAAIADGRIDGRHVEDLATLKARLEVAHTVKRLIENTASEYDLLRGIVLDRGLRSDADPTAMSTSPGHNLIRAISDDVWTEYARIILGITL